MGGSCSCIRLLVVILCFFYLICINGAIPLTRTSNLLHEHEINDQVPKTLLLEKLVKRRMEIEVNDYPGSGANNRHTPRAQLGRGCTDC